MEADKRIEKSKKLVSQYKKVFGSTEGRAVLYDLMLGNHLIRTTTHVLHDNESTYKNIGKQELVISIMNILKMDPEKFLNHVSEQEGTHV